MRIINLYKKECKNKIIKKEVKYYVIIFLICLDNGKEIKINELDTLKEENNKIFNF